MSKAREGIKRPVDILKLILASHLALKRVAGGM